MTPFDASGKKAFVQAISPFLTMFSTLSKTEIIIFVISNLSSANAFNLVWSKILLCGKGLRRFCVIKKKKNYEKNHIYTSTKWMLFRVYWNQMVCLSVHLSIHPCLSVCPYVSQNIGIFLILQFCCNLINESLLLVTLILYWSCARCSFQPCTPYDSEIISTWTLIFSSPENNMLKWSF